MKCLKFFIYIFFISNLIVQAQFDNFNFSTIPAEVFENTPITVSIELLDAEQVEQAVLFYRSFGTSEFFSSDITIQGNKLISKLDVINVISPSIELYFKTVNSSGVEKIYPTNALETMNFIRIDVKKKIIQTDDIIILHPSSDDAITKEDFFFAFSVLRIRENISLTSTKVFINDNDVSSLLQFSDDLIFIPAGALFDLNIGINMIKIFLYDNDGKKIKQYSSSFQIVTKEQKAEIEKLKFVFNGKLEINLANENLRNSTSNYRRLNLNLNGNYGSLFSNAYVYLTNEEKANLQAQNRFSFQTFNNWFRLDIGDHFPVYPSLILGGKRVRGFSSNLMFGFVNLQATYGEITRKIEGHLISLVRRDSIVLDPNLIPLDSSKYGQPFGLVRFGAYSRKLFAIRPSFGTGENFQLGFTYLHSRDEEKSINFGAKPKENLVVGTDLSLGFDQKRIQLNFQSAFSLLNKDIASGNISDATLDSLSRNNNLGIDVNILKKVRDILGKFITVNQHLSPLYPQELPTLAAEGNFSLNYLGNYLKGTYLFRGNEYTSFGQNYLRTDIKGFQLLDRLSLFENKIFLSFSYERLNDNLQKTKIATTTFNNYEGSISLYLRRDFPLVNFTYSNYDTKNDIEQNGADSIRLANIINDNIKVFNFSSSYDLHFYIKHKLSISYLSSNKKDFTYKDFSSSFSSFAFSVQNIWERGLISFINTSVSNSKIKNTEFDYFSITFGGRIILLDNKLNNSASINIFMGDLKRSIFDLSSQYNLYKNLSAGLSLRFIFNDRNIQNENIINFYFRYDI